MIKKIGLLLLLSALSCKTFAGLAVGDNIREANLFGLNTPSTKLSTLLGKPMIINFWASWCGPCINEMQSLNNIANNQHYTIIGISTDDETSKAIKLINTQKLTFKNYIDHKMKLEKIFGANTIPLTVFINQQGTVIKIIKGSQQWDSQKNTARIRKLFKLAK